jgi:hypothetical protein
LINNLYQELLDIKQIIGEKKIKTISYRPNHVDGRRWNGGTDRVSPERCPLSAGGPRLILSYLHVIILNKVRNNEQEKY